MNTLFYINKNKKVNINTIKIQKNNIKTISNNTKPIIRIL